MNWCAEGHAGRWTRRAAGLALIVAAVLLALAAPAGGAGPALVSVTAHSVTLRLPGGTHDGRYRPAGARVWHRVTPLGRRRSWHVAGLRPATTYRFEVRSCVRARCGRWSSPLTAGTAPLPAPAGCPILPADNPINTDISTAPVDPNSAAYIDGAGASGHLHPDFGSDPSFGIPYTVVGRAQRPVPIRFTAYGDQSDPGPYPIPLDAPVERGGDAHVLALAPATCRLYELFGAARTGDGWSAQSGAIFNLRSNKLRPDGWTSADAAGLPILPLLVRYDEVAAGHINHALRFTVARTQRGYIHPATHFASNSSDPSLMPMGLRLRLKASFDSSSFTGAARVVLEALRHYGMIVADNGSSWFISGASDSRWDDRDLDQLKSVPATAFEVVRTSAIRR